MFTYRNLLAPPPSIWMIDHDARGGWDEHFKKQPLDHHLDSTISVAEDNESIQQDKNRENALPAIDKKIFLSKVATVEAHSTKKPTAIIHAGPHKTASTAIQQTIVQYSKRGILRLDNFAIPMVPNVPGTPRKKSSWIAQCFYNKSEPLASWYGCDAKHRNDTLDYFTSFLSDALESKTNVLISSEEFDRPGVNMTVLKSYLKGFHVHVVIFYRRFYQWVLSFYNQEAKNGVFQQTFVDWLQTDGNLETLQLLHTAKVYERFKVFFDVSILNIHDASLSILPTFFCKHVFVARH